MDSIRVKKFFAAAVLVSAVLLCLEGAGLDAGFAEEMNAGDSTQSYEAGSTTANDDSSDPAVVNPDGQTTGTNDQVQPETDTASVEASTPQITLVKKPKKVKRLKVRSKVEGQAVVKWRKVKCSGYKIRYARNKSFTEGRRTVKVSKRATSFVINGLEKGRKYYFKIRAYRVKNGKTAYGKWSKVRKVRIHKHKYIESTSRISTGVLHTHKCSCGQGYYKTDASDGKTYDGYLQVFSTCVPGKLQKTIGGSIKSLAIRKAHTPVKGADGKYVCKVCGQKMKYISLSVPVTVPASKPGLTTKADEAGTGSAAEQGTNQSDGSKSGAENGAGSGPENGAENSAESGAENGAGSSAENGETGEDATETVYQDVIFTAPRNTNSNSTVAATVQNIDGELLHYKLYWQKSTALEYKYEKYREYFKMHGCSTCALTTVLNAVVPKYADFTPDRVLEEVIRPVVGEKTFKKNFSKSLRGQMPIGLRGISKVLKANGVKHKYVYNYTKKSAAKEIKEHLQSGNPVIFMIRRSTYAHNPHAMVMLGLDKKGQVIVGDSSLCSASKWGTNNRLIKYNTRFSKTSNSVKNICKFFKYSAKSVKGVTDFYNGKKGNIGYILVYK